MSYDTGAMGNFKEVDYSVAALRRGFARQSVEEVVLVCDRRVAFYQGEYVGDRVLRGRSQDLPCGEDGMRMYVFVGCQFVIDVLSCCRCVYTIATTNACEYCFYDA